MLDIVPTDPLDHPAPGAPRRPAKSLIERAAPAPRDWSNVVFSVVFCEEARRLYEGRNES